MRFEGTLTSWNDDRGFGFIEPAQGGQDVFVHVKAFARSGGRPQVGQRVSFEIELGPNGRKRARRVEAVRPAHSTRKTRRDSPAQWGTATLFVIPAFAVLYAIVAILWRPPPWCAAVYAGASVLTFLAYALDKSSAASGERRTSESTLHLLSLAGGWPGALVAQQVLRHKTVKAEFRSVFWGTVGLNVAGFVFLSSPAGRQLLTTA